MYSKDRNIFLSGECIWLKIWFLQTFGISKGYLENILSKNRTGKSLGSKSWKLMVDDFGEIYVLFDSLPRASRRKIGKTEADFLKEVLQDGDSIEDSERKVEVSRISMVINNQAEFHWQKYEGNYPHFAYLPDKLAPICRSHAIFFELISFWENRTDLKILFQAFLLVPTNLRMHYYTSSWYSFRDKIKKCKKEGIENVLLHKSYGKRYRLKLTERWIQEIATLYASPRQFSHEKITEKINKKRKEEGLGLIARSTVTEIINSPFIQNTAVYSRLGEKKFRKRIVGNHVLYSEYAGSVIELDGKPLAFSIDDGDGKEEIWVLLMAIDHYSNRILSYRIAPEENVHTALEVIKEAIHIMGIIPKQIITDGHASYRSKKWKLFSNKLKELSSEHHIASKGHSQSNGKIEKTFGTLDSKYFKNIKYYLGAGIRSKKDDNIPSEEWKIISRQKQNRKAPAELYHDVKKAIAKFNQNPNLKYGVPNRRYEESMDAMEIPEKFKVGKKYFAFLFWNWVNHKIEESTITLPADGYSKEYTVDRPQDIRSYNGTTQTIYYNPDVPEVVYVFSKHQPSKWLFTAPIKVPINKNLQERVFEEQKYVNEQENKYHELLRENEDYLLPDEDREEAHKQNKGSRFHVPGYDSKSKTNKSKYGLSKGEEDEIAKKFKIKK